MMFHRARRDPMDRSRGQGEDGERLPDGWGGVSFGATRMFWNPTAVVVAQLANAPNVTELLSLKGLTVHLMLSEFYVSRKTGKVE